MKLSIAEAHALIDECGEKIKSYVDTWRVYEQSYGIWNAKKRGELQRMDLSMESPSYFDARLDYYGQLKSAMCV